MRAGLLVVALWAAGCAKSGAVDTPVEDPPAWADPQGRNTLRLELATSMVNAGAPEGAMAIVRALRDEGAKDAQVDLLEARVLTALGLTEDAVLILRTLVKRHPRQPEAHSELGLLLAELKDLDGAIAAFERATKLDKTDPEIWNNLGFCLHAAGRYPEAVDALRVSLRLDPTRVQTRNNLGFALFASGREDDAWRVFKAGQGEAGAHYNLGVAHELKGSLGQARSRYAQALKVEPAHQQARAALARLESPSPAPSEVP